MNSGVLRDLLHPELDLSISFDIVRKGKRWIGDEVRTTGLTCARNTREEGIASEEFVYRRPRSKVCMKRLGDEEWINIDEFGN